MTRKWACALIQPLLTTVLKVFVETSASFWRHICAISAPSLQLVCAVSAAQYGRFWYNFQRVFGILLKSFSCSCIHSCFFWVFARITSSWVSRCCFHCFFFFLCAGCWQTSDGEDLGPSAAKRFFLEKHKGMMIGHVWTQVFGGFLQWKFAIFSQVFIFDLYRGCIDQLNRLCMLNE